MSSLKILIRIFKQVLDDLRLNTPLLVEKSILTLLPFVKTYCCEADFSSYAYIKNMYGNRLDAAPDLQIQFSGIKTKF